MFQSVVICVPGAVREGDGLRVAGTRDVLHVAPLPGARLVELETCDYRDHQGAPTSIRRARFEPEAGEMSSGCVEYFIAI